MPELFRRSVAERRSVKFSVIPGFLFALFAVCGYLLEIKGSVIPGFGMLLCILLLTIVFTLLISALWISQGRASASLAVKKTSPVFRFIFTHPAVLMLIMLVCWLPCYLSIYPGNFAYDSSIEYNQCAYGYNDAMPFLHSWILVNALLKALVVTGSVSPGIAFLTIGQMILLSALFSMILVKLYHHGVNRTVLTGMLCYYALFPTIHFLVTCPIRDVLFSGLLTLCFLEILYALENREAFLRSQKSVTLAGLTGALTILSRNNSNSMLAYLLIALICIIVLLWAKRSLLSGGIGFSASLIVCYAVLSVFLSLSCRPQTSLPSNTSLSFLTQPIARAYTENGGTWSAEERAAYETYFDTDGLLYAEGLGDISSSKLKTTLDENGSHTGFIRLWLQIGAKHPGSYINAWLANTKALWLPGAVIDGYNYEGSIYPTYKDYETSYFSFLDFMEPPAQFEGKLPAVHRFYAALAHDITFERIPVVSLLFSVGFHFWLLLYAFFLALYKQAVSFTAALGLIVLYVLISAFVPIILIRYFSTLFFIFPIVFCFCLQPGKKAVSSKSA